MAKVKLSHRSRLEACLSQGTPDRAPVALWRHFPVDDQTPEGLARAVLQFQEIYDFDFVKVTPASSYCLKDWGVKDVWNGNSEGTRDYTNVVIHHPDDWSTLPLLDPRSGTYGDQIKCLRLIHAALNNNTPLIQTIFSPLAQAKHLCGPDELLRQIHSAPEQLHSGLEVITETTIRFIQECARTGIDGIYYAVQHAQQSLLTQAVYAAFGTPYDIRILAAANDLWFNVLHLHGKDVYFDLLAGYPVQVINWHDRETSYSLHEGLKHTQSIISGGLRQWQTLALGTTEDVTRESQDALEQTGGIRFILGTGCVLPIIAPHGNILACRQAVER
jgi:uroporphyrinogen decarboxylase